MATEQVWSNKSYEFPLEEIRKLAPDIQWKYLPVIAPTLSPVEHVRLLENGTGLVAAMHGG